MVLVFLLKAAAVPVYVNNKPEDPADDIDGDHDDIADIPIPMTIRMIPLPPPSPTKSDWCYGKIHDSDDVTNMTTTMMIMMRRLMMQMRTRTG